MRPEWEGFVPGRWNDDEVNVRDFIQRNYTPYEGDGSFLAPATGATKKLWNDIMELSAEERKAGGVLKADNGSRVHAHLARPRLYRQGPRKDSGIADRRALQALAAALRRHKDGRTGAQHVRLPDRARDQGDLHKVPQDAQRRRLRRIYPRNAPCPAARTSSPACPTPTAGAG